MNNSKDHYFQVYENYFWQWEENNELLTIPGGNTIAYRDYVAEVMSHLSVQGLPSFGSLLLAIIATNPDHSTFLPLIKEKLKSFFIDPRGSNIEYFDKAFVFVERLSQVTPDLKKGQKRILLFQTIFQNSHNNTSRKTAKIYVDTIKMKRIVGEALTAKPLHSSAIMRDVRALALLSDKFPTVENITESLLDIPQNIDIELEELTRGGGFFSDLIKEPKTFHVGSLIKNLSAGLHIPMHYAAASEQPLGGVSDISNKGEFDKLLISEFANDDIVFLSRLANSEALYINRETPLHNDKYQRNILIDISLYNWGTPKTIAFAIMLALTNQPKNKIDYQVWLVGTNWHSVSFSTVQDIINIQAYVDSCLLPTDGLTEFFNSIHNNDNSETIILSNPESLKKVEMQSLINEYRKCIDYLISTDNFGKIDIYRVLRNNTKHIQSLSLNLKQSWNKEIEKALEKKKSKDEISPILYSPPVQSNLMQVEDDFYCIYQSILFKKTSTDKGWYIAYTKIEKNLSAYQLGLNEKEELVLLLCYNGQKKLELHNIITGEIKTQDFNKGVYFKNISFHQGSFYSIYSHYRLYEITMDLTISESRDDDLIKLLEEKRKDTNFTNPNFSSIWNVKHVAISKKNTVVINQKHELGLLDSGLYFKYFSYTDDKIKEIPTFEAFNKLRLKNGVTIHFHLGLLYIKLKDGRTLLVPMAIDTRLAMAVDDRVSGCSYFYSQNRDNQDLDSEAMDILRDNTIWN